MQTYVSKSHKHNNKSKVYSLDYTDADTDLSGLSADKDTCKPDLIVMEKEEKESIRNLVQQMLSLNSLSDRQKDYITMYYFESQTFEQIGKKYGITREAVRQGLNKALDILRSLIA
jgi:hypothetical protein